jgi:hypothetical protein
VVKDSPTLAAVGESPKPADSRMIHNATFVVLRPEHPAGDEVGATG